MTLINHDENLLSQESFLYADRNQSVKGEVSAKHAILTAVSGVGSSPALATCETSQVLLAGVPGGFSRGSPVFVHLLIGPSHMS